jgi:RHS repeat-associated protein
VTPESGDLEPLTKEDTVIPVALRGALKYSAAYDSLMSGRTGKAVLARHTVTVGGVGLSTVREVYGVSGEVEGRTVVAMVLGRGVPIGRVVHTDTGSVTQFFIKNHLGSTVRVVNADGSYATTPVFDYQPYGELQSIREDSLNPVNAKYTGKELDAEVNLHYFGARWYDQELGMWMTPDPARQFANPYSYGGDPVNYFDPTGLWSLGLGIVVGYENGGWHIGFGVAADFRQEIGFGANGSYVWNEDGSRTTSIGATVPLPVGNVIVYNGASYTHNTDDGHSANVVAGVKHKDGNLGAEIGTSHSWDNDGRYQGGNVYGQAYAGNPVMRVKTGYQQGWGGYESGPYANARLGGFSWSADKNGVRYDGFATSATAGYRFGEDQGFYVDYPGKGMVDYLSSERQPIAETPASGPSLGKRWFGTNWCGPGGDGGVTGKLDAACHAHDKRSDLVRADGPAGAFTVNAWSLAVADLQLVRDAVGASGSSGWGRAGVSAVFLPLGLAKMASHTGPGTGY